MAFVHFFGGWSPHSDTIICQRATALIQVDCSPLCSPTKLSSRALTGYFGVLLNLVNSFLEFNSHLVSTACKVSPPLSCPINHKRVKFPDFSQPKPLQRARDGWAWTSGYNQIFLLKNVIKAGSLDWFSPSTSIICDWSLKALHLSTISRSTADSPLLHFNTLALPLSLSLFLSLPLAVCVICILQRRHCLATAWPFFIRALWMCCGRSSRVQTRMLTLKLLLLPSAGLDHWQHTLRITLHLIPHPPGSQYLPTKQTLIPLLSSLSLPQTHPLRCFCTENAAGRSGAYQSGPWWLAQGPHRRAGSSGAPGPGAWKRLQTQREFLYVFMRYWWFQKTANVAQTRRETGIPPLPCRDRWVPVQVCLLFLLFQDEGGCTDPGRLHRYSTNWSETRRNECVEADTLPQHLPQRVTGIHTFSPQQTTQQRLLVLQQTLVLFVLLLDLLQTLWCRRSVARVCLVLLLLERQLVLLSHQPFGKEGENRSFESISCILSELIHESFDCRCF